MKFWWQTFLTLFVIKAAVLVSCQLPYLDKCWFLVLAVDALIAAAAAAAAAP